MPRSAHRKTAKPSTLVIKYTSGSHRETVKGNVPGSKVKVISVEDAEHIAEDGYQRMLKDGMDPDYAERYKERVLEQLTCST